MRIRGDRLLSDLNELATFGGREDGGVDRVAGSAADRAARGWLADRIKQAGLDAWTDASGNTFGRCAGSRGPWVLTGSHTDTVPAGGHLDGAYGTIAALEALRTLHEAAHPAAVGIEIVDFWDEEGALPSSKGGLVGSTALRDGAHAADVVVFVELHIEQGPRMERDSLELAIVDGIVGIDRYAVEVNGMANHAGTTPMDLRADAGRAAARIAANLWETVLGIDDRLVANVGHMEFYPGAPNVVPGRARFVVEFRAPTEQALAEAAWRLGVLMRETAAEEGCSVNVEQLSHKPVVRFDPEVCRALEETTRRTGAAVTTLTSFAGHDAGALSSRVPTAMLFVPSTGGISHSPAENTGDQLLVLGAQALLESLVELERRFLRGTDRTGTGGRTRAKTC